MDKFIAIKKISDHFSIPEDEILKALEKRKTYPKKKEGDKKEVQKEVKKETKKDGKTNEEKIERKQKNEPKKYLFLHKDYNHLLKKMDEVFVEIKRLGKEIGASCDETETFHDNFDYEECGRQKEMWTQYFKKLQKIKENAEIITEATSSDVIGIGNEIHLKSPLQGVIIKKIGSYLTFSNKELSYRSPLAKKLIGKKIGDEIILDTKHKNNNFVIKKIN